VQTSRVRSQIGQVRPPARDRSATKRQPELRHGGREPGTHPIEVNSFNLSAGHGINILISARAEPDGERKRRTASNRLRLGTALSKTSGVDLRRGEQVLIAARGGGVSGDREGQRARTASA